jgi:superfamily II DNA or RNA helicase
MNALNAKAAYWIRQGIFDDLRSFDAFEDRVNKIPEEKDRGDAFEIFIEGYLATQTITQRVNHWVVGNIPLSLRERYKLPNDGTGIDGIYETHDGNQVAYQVKYRQKQRLTFAEVAPFLGITEHFSDRVIFTNAATLSDKAIVRTRWVNGEAFRALSADAFSVIEAWLKQKPLPIVRAKPDPNYQTQALADIKATLSKRHRATVVMACGTGKTLVSLWAAEQESPETVLVLVPSLTLLKQTLLEWSKQTSWGDQFSYICVCSDPTVNLKDDALNTDTSEVGFRVDTDPVIVRRFLERQTADIKVVFSTYQSAHAVAEGANTLPPFDLAIFDEAHKTIRGASAFALSDESIKIRKRLFFTATPRHIDVHHRDKEGEFRFYSMDDEAVYGPRAHTLSFGTAANKGIISRYKVIVALIDKKMVDDFTRKQGITLVERDEIGARWMANLIAVQKSIEEVDASKIITFHSRVRLAQEFASKEPRGIAYHLPDYDVRHVNGEQSSGDRAEIIGAFSDADKSLLTNARCLTEGINIPAVDMVVFIDPRQSRIDITQAVGRAMRKPRCPTTKTVGYVVVPLFAGMGDGDDFENAVKSEKFDAVVDVLNALQDHDQELVDIIREIKQRKGAGEPFNPRSLSDKLEVIGPRVDLDALTRSIGVEISDRIGSNWDEWFGRLRNFVDREGHCYVPSDYEQNGYRLGRWVGTQRGLRDLISDIRRPLSAERREQLDELGFVWDIEDAAWEEGFKRLEQCKELNGHCRVARGYREGNYPLGQWVSVQRERESGASSARLPLSEDRKRRLNDLGFVWNPSESAWEAGIRHLSLYKEREGHSRAPRFHHEKGFALGGWVASLRTRNAKVSDEQRQHLNNLGFIWDPLKRAWEEGFEALTAFKAREGHCGVAAAHIEGTYRLGKWVTRQRNSGSEISVERRQRLDAIGFVWDPLEEAWERGFEALTAFKAREGHLRVPPRHVEGTYRLRIWVTEQRTNRDSVSAERKRRLNELGFVWEVHDSNWEEGFAALATFKAREGHCRVPFDHVEETSKLGSWVSKQRNIKDTMSAERRQRLNAIGFVWDPIESGWEKCFAALTAFKAREGHCRVPQSHLEGSIKLDMWVGTQRKSQNTLSAERKQRLDAIGFVWDPLKDAWEEGIAALMTFKAREGHCRVPSLHCEGTFRLGQWVGDLRKRKDKVSPERRQQLDDIDFVWRAKGMQT